MVPRPTVEPTRVQAPGASSSLFGSGITARTIYNLNVRGKRGNIVQTFPAVEYDFVPAQLTVNDEDLIHFQVCTPDIYANLPRIFMFTYPGYLCSPTPDIYANLPRIFMLTYPGYLC